MRRAMLGFIGATCLMTGAVYADYTFKLSDDPNACEQISGEWSGNGKASSWFLGTCSYHGRGTVSTVDSTGRFTVDATADKDHGSDICPDHVSKRIDAQCSNGVVTIKTEFGNLKGSFTPNSGRASGTLSVLPGIEADVIIQFNR